VERKSTSKVAVETRTVTRKSTLTREEELVVRMSRGLSEGPAHALEFRGQQDRELRARLALIEAMAFAEVNQAGTVTDDPGVEVDEEMRTKILARLRSLSK
jgi:hypothetical protein